MLLIGTLAAALTLTSDDGWARFSARQALSRLSIDVEIGIEDRTPGAPTYWIRRTVQRPRQKTQISRTDTGSCPRMLAALRSLRDLPMPRANMPLLDDAETTVTVDGTHYELTMPVAYAGASLGDLTLTSKDDTPLAAWVENTLSTLDSCMPK
jgi:hypothetical protein